MSALRGERRSSRELGTGVALRPREGMSAFCTMAVISNWRNTMADDLDRDGAENQIKGLGNELKGKARNAIGDVTGDRSEQIKGKAQEFKGKVQRKIGEAESDADDNL